MRPPKHPAEESRLAALHRYGVLDTDYEDAFDNLVRLAADLCDTPIALITLIDRDRQWFKSHLGIEKRETPLDKSVCAYAILEHLEHDLFVVPDLQADVRFADIPRVAGEQPLRFYAGAQLRDPEGYPLGKLCVADTRTRELTQQQKDILKSLADQVMALFERRAAEKALEESEARFRQFADTMPQIIFAARPDGHVDYFNRRWYEYSGFPVDGRTGDESWIAIHAPERLEQITQVWNEAMRTGQPYQIEYPLRRHDGQWRWHLGRAMPVRDAQGKIVRWFGTNTDIHDQKMARELDEFLVRLDDAIRPLTDPEQVTLTAARLLGQHLNVDRCAYADIEADQDTMNLTGNYTRRPEIRSIVGRLRFTDFGAEVLALMRADKPYVVDDVDTHTPPVGDPAAYRATQIQAVICVPLHKAGRFVAAMAVHSATPRHWTQDEVELVQMVAARCWESIERARVARTLRQSEARYRIVASTVSDAIWDWDLTTNSVWWSAGISTLFGYAEGHVRPELSWWHEHLHPEDSERVIHGIHAVIDNPALGDDWTDEYRFQRADGSWACIHDKGRVLREEGHAVRMLGAMQDVTELREAERHERFLSNLSECLHAMEGEDPEALLDTTIGALGEILEVTRCAVGTVDAEREIVSHRREWRSDSSSFSSSLGEYRLSTYGEFFAGEILAGKTVVVSDTTTDLRTSDAEICAAYAALGVRAAAAVPLIREGRCVAMLGVNESQPRLWTPGEIELVEAVAQRAWAAAENARLRRERDEAARKNERIAETLQRSLLIAPAPVRLPPGVDIGTEYQAARDEAMIGGDFYDAFALEGSRVALVVGDATGKGLKAAEHIAEVKYTLRVILRENPDASPAVVLERLNALSCSSQQLDVLPDGSYVAVAVAVLNVRTGEGSCATAGMEPPLILRLADGAAEEIAVSGMLIGMFPGATYEAADFTLCSGDLLALTTDGLTEARQDRDFFGMAGVAAALREAIGDGSSLPDAARHTVAQAIAFAGGTRSDDMCLLLARRLTVSAS